MKKRLSIAFLFHVLFVFGQEAIQSEVNYLSYDPFYGNDSIVQVLFSPLFLHLKKLAILCRGFPNRKNIHPITCGFFQW